MKKGKIISIPKTDEVVFVEHVGQMVERIHGQPDRAVEEIVERKSIELLKRQLVHRVSSSMTLLPNHGIRHNVLSVAKKKIDNIIEKGFNVYVKDGIVVKHETRNDRFGNFDIFRCEYFVNEEEIYKIIFCEGVTDDTISEAIQTGKYFVNKKIEELYERTISKTWS